MPDLYDLTSTLDGLRSDIEEAFGEMDELREKADKYDEIESEFDDLDAVREKVSAYDEIEASCGDMSEAREKLSIHDDLVNENEAMKLEIASLEGKVEGLEEENTRLKQDSEKHVRALADDAAGLVQQIKNLLHDEAVRVPTDPTAADYAQRLVNVAAHLYVTTKVRQEEAA